MLYLDLFNSLNNRCIFAYIVSILRRELTIKRRINHIPIDENIHSNRLGFCDKPPLSSVNTISTSKYCYDVRCNKIHNIY